MGKRTLILAGIAALAAEACLETNGIGLVTGSCNAVSYMQRKSTYVSAEDISKLLKEQGIESRVENTKGNRTLLILGDFHLGFGKTYDDFVKNIGDKISMDRIFMEGVYDSSTNSDPHFAYMNDLALLEGREVCPEKIKKEDPQGYYRLSKNHSVNGIESLEMTHDSELLSQLWKKVLLYPLNESDSEAKGIKEVYSSLIKKDFGLGNFPDISKEELKKLSSRIGFEMSLMMFVKRNIHFSNVIDNKLRPYENGLLVVGEAHMDKAKMDAIMDGFGKHSLDRELASKGISTVYIDVGKVCEYNKKMQNTSF